MPSYKLPFGLVLQETAIVLLFLVHRLLLQRYVFFVCHKICFAIIAHASASARAWWWFVISGNSRAHRWCRQNAVRSLRP